MKKWFLALLGFALIALVASCDVASDFDRRGGEEAFEKNLLETRDTLRQSNVGVEMNVTPAREENGGYSTVSRGSGVIVDANEDGYYVLTNYHVVDTTDTTGQSFSVIPLTSEGNRIIAEKVAKCETRDLALLRFESEETFTPIDIDARKGDSLDVGEFVLAAGNPNSIDGVVTFGEFKGMVDVRHVDFKVVAHSALIYAGSSGGALSDKDGHLIGINTWSSSSGEEPLNMAVPLDEIHDFLDSYWSNEE